MSRLFFRTHAESNPFVTTRTASTDLSLSRSYIWLVTGIVKIFAWENWTKRKLHDRKTEQFKAFSKYDNFSAFASHINTTGHNTEWVNFDILASGKTKRHYKIKETLFSYELKPVLMSMSVVKSSSIVFWKTVSVWKVFNHNCRLCLSSFPYIL